MDPTSTSIFPNTTTPPSTADPFFQGLIIYVFSFLATLADFLGSFSSLLSVLIFAHLWKNVPLYTLTLALGVCDLVTCGLDTISFLIKIFTGASYWSFDYFVYGIVWTSFCCQIWVVVLMVLERWSKHRHDSPWSHLKLLRLTAAVCILSLTFNMVRFFEISMPNAWHSDSPYFIGYLMILTLTTQFFIPYMVVLIFAVWTVRLMNKPFQRLSYEEKCEQSRTKMVLIVAVCFVFITTFGYAVFACNSIFSHWYTYDQWLIVHFLYELYNVTSSCEVILHTVFFVSFLDDFRRVLVDSARKLFFCCCKRFPSPSQNDIQVYSHLTNDIDHVEAGQAM